MTVRISYDHAVKLQCCIKIGKSEKITLFGTLWAIDLYMLSTALCTPKSDACGIPGVSGSRPEPTQSALELGPSHCPTGRLGDDLGFGGFAFALKLPELLSRNLSTFRAKLGRKHLLCLMGPKFGFQ